MITDKNATSANKTAPTTIGSLSGEMTNGVGVGVLEGVDVLGMMYVTWGWVGDSFGVSEASGVALGAGVVVDSVAVGVYEGLRIISSPG